MPFDERSPNEKSPFEALRPKLGWQGREDVGLSGSSHLPNEALFWAVEGPPLEDFVSGALLNLRNHLEEQILQHIAQVGLTVEVFQEHFVVEIVPFKAFSDFDYMKHSNRYLIEMQYKIMPKSPYYKENN